MIINMIMNELVAVCSVGNFSAAVGAVGGWLC